MPTPPPTYIIVPETIFDYAPPVKNIVDYRGLGAQFKTYKNNKKFSVSVTFEISQDAYYNDIPLVINNKKFDLNNIGSLVLNNYGYDGQLSDLVLVTEISESVSKETVDDAATAATDKLEEIKNGLIDPTTLPDCPTPTPAEASATSAANTSTVEIKNKDNVVIQTVTMDLSDNTMICPNSNGTSEALKATYLNNLPNMNPGNHITPSTVSPICNLPDHSELKTTIQTKTKELNLNQTTLEDYNTNLLDNGIHKAVTDQINLIEAKTGKTLADSSPANINNNVNNLIQNSLPNYCIPILTINADLNIIIQVENGKLSVLNFDNYISGQTDPNLNNAIPDIGKKKLEILYDTDTDAKIIPEVMYTVVYTRNFNYHTIELKRFYGTKVFKDEEVSSVETGLYYLGMDKGGLKQFCGIIHDVHLQEDPIDINNITFSENYIPDLYGALAYYDFYNKSEEDTRVIYNRVYPYKSLGKPLAIRGRYWYLESRKSGNYTFPNHCYIDDMFCKNKFTDKSFGIVLFFKRNAFMTPLNPNAECSIHKQVLVSDPVNDNYIYYNEQSMHLEIRFHGYRSEIFVNFIPDIWYQVTFRYNFNEQKFYTDIFYKNLDPTQEYSFLNAGTTQSISDVMELDPDLDTARGKHFLLNSLYAEYSFTNKGYVYPFDTVCGPIVLYNKFVEDDIVAGLIETFYPVLHYYKDVGGIYDENGILDNY